MIYMGTLEMLTLGFGLVLPGIVDSFFNSDFKVFILKLSQYGAHSDILSYSAMIMRCQ